MHLFSFRKLLVICFCCVFLYCCLEMEREKRGGREGWGEDAWSIKYDNNIELFVHIWYMYLKVTPPFGAFFRTCVCGAALPQIGRLLPMMQKTSEEAFRVFGRSGAYTYVASIKLYHCGCGCISSCICSCDGAIAIVHPESPWTKDTFRHRVPVVSRCVRMFNFLCADARRHRHTHTRRRRRRCTHVDECKFLATFHVQTVICLGLESLSPPILVPCWWLSITRNTVGRSFPKPRPPSYSIHN